MATEYDNVDRDQLLDLQMRPANAEQARRGSYRPNKRKARNHGN